MKKIIALVLSVFIAVGMVPVTAQAEANYNSENVTWLGNAS